MHDARIVANVAAPRLNVDGLPGGKGTGAAVGAGTGSGAGVAVGVAVCMAAGPLFPLCLLTVVPATTAVGATTGVVVGAIRTETSLAIETKASAVKAELAATSYQTLLAEKLRGRLKDDYALGLPLQSPVADPTASVEPGASTGPAPLELLVGVTEVGTEGKRVFAVRLVTEIVLRRSPTDIVWRTAREVQSNTELTVDEWTSRNSEALRGVLEACVRTAADRLMFELARGIAGTRESLARTGQRYSTSCDDRPADWLQAQAQLQ
ncbi:MAG: hypothetical protein ABI585_16155 [Betaproteobacteria bacterium]